MQFAEQYSEEQVSTFMGTWDDAKLTLRKDRAVPVSEEVAAEALKAAEEHAGLAATELGRLTRESEEAEELAVAALADAPPKHHLTPRTPCIDSGHDLDCFRAKDGHRTRHRCRSVLL